jgi:hypothetical protein
MVGGHEGGGGKGDRRFQHLSRELINSTAMARQALANAMAGIASALFMVLPPRC